MKILLIAASEAEIVPLIETLSDEWDNIEGRFEQGNKTLHICITGVGTAATSYRLTKELCGTTKYDLIIQAGIAGSFDRNLKIGEVVKIESDCFADLGAEDGDTFLDIFELGLTGMNDKPYINGRLNIVENELITAVTQKSAIAITVNTTTGNAVSAERLLEKYNCSIESMEGAAVHYVCLQEGIPFLQIRAVSNYVERRNRNVWNIPLAVANLNAFLLKYLNNI